ncbi:FtsP/CotA-like multicopper oxidase with cupredoxin domain [Mesorhizobium soli]|nr:FtsP/CotA-like multicopper oxidase with cupredoxin domain [Mesorhizobium soli]
MKPEIFRVFVLLASALPAGALGTFSRAAEVGTVTVFQPDADGTLEVNMRAAAQEVTIGPYKVVDNPSLVVCDKKGPRCADPYVGAVLQLSPRNKLSIDLTNALESKGGSTPDHCMVMDGTDDSLLNLHTHGLLVSPYQRKSNSGHVFGDNSFSCTSAQGTNGAVVGKTMHYEMTLDDIGVNGPHPLGIDWIHPHVHGIAKQQLASGMASMIVVGDVNAQLCAKPSPDGKTQLNHCVQISSKAVKHMILKDAQLMKYVSDPPAPDVYHNYTDQNPDFCGVNKLNSGNFGECDADLTSLGDPKVKSGRWVFTINGQQTPHWEIAPDHYEIWRIQNGSANITYRLSLQALAYGQNIARKASFQVLDMDGAGLAPSSAPATVDAPTTQEILLMPGNRADLLVQSPRENSSDVTYALVNDRFQAGYSIGDADVWPHVTLATVRFKASRAYVAAVQTLPAPIQAFAAITPAKVDETRLAADLPNLCVGFDDPTLTAPQKQFFHDHLHIPADWKRRIYFGVVEDTFALGSTLIDNNGNETDVFGRPIADHKVRLSAFSMGGKSDLCVRKDPEPETWELVNVSNEVHNFHIHQLKFAIERQIGGPDDGKPIMRAPSPIDAVGIPNTLLFKNGQADLLHDTIIVPRGSSVPSGGPDHLACGHAINRIDENDLQLKPAAETNECTGMGENGDLSGMIRIRLDFGGAQLAAFDAGGRKMENARFSYHCHILEHEDKGMMASVTVVDPSIYH